MSPVYHRVASEEWDSRRRHVRTFGTAAWRLNNLGCLTGETQNLQCDTLKLQDHTSQAENLGFALGIVELIFSWFHKYVGNLSSIQPELNNIAGLRSSTKFLPGKPAISHPSIHIIICLFASFWIQHFLSFFHSLYTVSAICTCRSFRLSISCGLANGTPEYPEWRSQALPL